MNWALRWLELPPDADATAIKRAYARRLRQHRPDTDPEGFQQLHAAYQAALAWARAREADAQYAQAEMDEYAAGEATEHADAAPVWPGASADGDDADRPAVDAGRGGAAAGTATASDAATDTDPGTDAADDADAGIDLDALVHDWRLRQQAAAPPPPLPPSPHAALAHTAHDPQPQAVDLDTLCGETIALAMRADPPALQDWLERQPALWSLQHKAQVGGLLCYRLQQHTPPLRRDNFAVLLDFFGLDDIAAGTAAHALPMLQERLHLAWEVQPENVGALARRIQGVTPKVAWVRARMPQLTRPFALPQALWAGLPFGRPGALRLLAMHLDHGRVDALPAPVDRQQVMFWIRAGDMTRLSRPRLMLGLARCAVASLLAALALWLLASLGAWSAEPADLARTLSRSAQVAAAIGGSWALWVLACVLLRWQSEPEAAPSPAPWLRLSFLPLLIGSGLLLVHAADQRVAGTVLVDTALLLAAVRIWRRRGLVYQLSGNYWWLVFLIPLGKGLLLLFAFAEAGAALALGLWTWDLVLQRRSLRWRRS